MPTLQVRDLPEELHRQLVYLAQRDRRSLAQETVVILREGIAAKLKQKDKKGDTLDRIKGLQLNKMNLSDPTELIRQDRER